MKIETGDYEIVFSGTAITFNGQPLRIELEDNIEGNYVIVFDFINDLNMIGSKTRLVSFDQFLTHIHFINFAGAANTGNTELIDLGTLCKKKLYLNYRVTDLKGVGYTVVFNFIVEKEVRSV